MALSAVPLTLGQANALVGRWHRHHEPVTSHRFSIGAEADGVLVGAVIVARPAARLTNQAHVAEVARLVTDGTPNACSFLYQAAARTAKAMGFRRIQTFILEPEPGTSLKAAGWRCDGMTSATDPRGWAHSKRGQWVQAQLTIDGTRLPRPTGPKQRWMRELNPAPGGGPNGYGDARPVEVVGVS
jgi:hypothetical protein